MFSDSLTLTIGGNATVFNRVNNDKYSSEYRHRWSGGLYRFTIRHSTYTDKSRNGGTQRDRHNCELVCQLDPTTEYPYVREAKQYFVLDFDVGRFPEVSVLDMANAAGQLFAGANLSKLLNWES